MHWNQVEYCFKYRYTYFIRNWYCVSGWYVCPYNQLLVIIPFNSLGLETLGVSLPFHVPQGNSHPVLGKVKHKGSSPFVWIKVPPPLSLGPIIVKSIFLRPNLPATLISGTRLPAQQTKKGRKYLFYHPIQGWDKPRLLFCYKTNNISFDCCT